MYVIQLLTLMSDALHALQELQFQVAMLMLHAKQLVLLQIFVLNVLQLVIQIVKLGQPVLVLQYAPSANPIIILVL